MRGVVVFLLFSHVWWVSGVVLFVVALSVFGTFQGLCIRSICGSERVYLKPLFLRNFVALKYQESRSAKDV